MLDFIAQIVDSLAWPAAVVTAVVLLRRHMPQLIDAVRKVRVPGVEIELERARADVAELVQAELPGPASQDPSVAFLVDSPSRAISVSFDRLDSQLRKVVGDSDIDTDLRSFIEVVELGRRTGALSQKAADAALALLMMRNVALQPGSTTLNSGDAAEYALLVDATLAAIDES